jgi:hypothetical protein
MAAAPPATVLRAPRTIEEPEDVVTEPEIQRPTLTQIGPAMDPEGSANPEGSAKT